MNDPSNFPPATSAQSTFVLTCNGPVRHPDRSQLCPLAPPNGAKP